MNQKKKKWEYSFEWVDEIVCRRLKPDQINRVSANAGELLEIRKQFKEELDNSYRQFKASVFLILSDKKIRIAGQRYYDTLQYLLSSARENLAAQNGENSISEVCEFMVIELEALKREFNARFHKFLSSTGETTRQSDPQLSNVKLTCRLSVDQIGIILKAADDTRLIISRSLSYIYRAIVPFLSTEKISKISWNSMRTGAYKVERSDKEQVISVLENMIRKIRDY